VGRGGHKERVKVKEGEYDGNTYSCIKLKK
jgi:hypothetical protein